MKRFSWKLSDKRVWGRSVLAILIVIVGLDLGVGFAADTQRDEYGVWFIKGADGDGLYEIFHAMGQAVAEDRLWQLELFRRQARGMLAEVFGPDQLEADIFNRTVGYSAQELAQGFAGLDQEAQQMINGYVAGVNLKIEHIAGNPNLLPFEFKALSAKLGRPILPGAWSPEDVLAWMALVLRSFDGEAFDTTQLNNLALLSYLSQLDASNSWDMFQDLRWTNDPDAQTYLEPAPGKNDLLRSASAESQGRVSHVGWDTRAIGKKIRRIFKNLEKINARVKMGSYAWAISGTHTRSGNPVIYSGPQMGFSAPSIVLEGSIHGAGLEVSGMSIAGLPLIIIGRTPHHAWSMQTGQAHTTDYFFETPQLVELHRMETIQVAGADPITIPVYRSRNGPVINPLPLDLSTYQEENDGPIVAWRYANRETEFLGCNSFLNWVRATDTDQFDTGVEQLGSSQHVCYADRNGNIAYWMSGRSPIRTAGEWRLPQGALPGVPSGQWIDGQWLPMPADRNPSKGYYAGWNNKSLPDYQSGFNTLSYLFGPFHRSHVITDFLDRRLSRRWGKLSFRQLRNLALRIATTDSLALGGNPWRSLAPYFTHAVLTASCELEDRQLRRKRMQALWLLWRWNGRFVTGRPANWARDPDRSDAWMLMDAWTHEVLRLTFADELGAYYGTTGSDPMDAKSWPTDERRVLINVLLHGLNDQSALQNRYDWFGNADTGAPQTRDAIIVAALDRALDDLGARPWGVAQRGTIDFIHPILKSIDGLEVVWRTPFASRSTYAQIVEIGPGGPTRIQSMFPLGQSGTILASDQGAPVFDPNFFSMTEIYDDFLHRPFPLFE